MLSQEGPSVHCVEGIRRISFEEDGAWGLFVSLAPLANCVEARLGAEGLAYANLKGEQKSACIPLVVCA